MTVTEEDVQDKGIVKQEVSGDMKGVAQRQSPNIYGYFEEVCSDLGMDPGVLLADMAIRVLEDEAFKNQVAGVDVSLEQVKINQIREEDLDFVMDLHDKFAEEDTGPSKVDNLIDKMIENQISSPMAMPGMGDGSGGTSSEERRLRRKIGSLENELKQIRSAVERGNVGGSEQTSDSISEEEREEEIDSLFDDDEVDEDSDDEEEEFTPEPDIAVTEVEEEPDEDDGDETDIPASSEEGSEDG